MLNRAAQAQIFKDVKDDHGGHVQKILCLLEQKLPTDCLLSETAYPWKYYFLPCQFRGRMRSHTQRSDFDHRRVSGLSFNFF